MSHALTLRLIRHDFARLTTTKSEQAPKEALCCSTIAPSLEVHINDCNTLVHSSPKAVLLATDLDGGFSDEETVSAPALLSCQASGADCSECEAPQANSFAANGDTPLGK